MTRIQGLPEGGPSIGTVNVPVPQGEFTLSLMACSNNGPSLALAVVEPFVERYGLSVNFEKVLRSRPAPEPKR